MNFRILGKTGFNISEVSLGTWQVGGKWGSGFDDKLAQSILQAALEEGVNFIDTADVYEAGMSEQAVGKAVRAHQGRVYVATKCGRQINPHVNEGYTPDALQSYVEYSLTRLGLECLDLVQLHCPPTEVYYRPEIFERFERLKEQGKILNLGVSVEKVEEAIKAIEYSNVHTVQIIFNVFRQRPADLFFKLAAARSVGILARVPLASGLLTGKFSAQSEFATTDHRNFNREGAHFDKGETFSGIDYQLGLNGMEMLKDVFPGEQNLAPRALQWILSFPEVSCVIPGASNVDQVYSNLSLYQLDELSPAQIDSMNKVYHGFIKSSVHHLW